MKKYYGYYLIKKMKKINLLIVIGISLFALSMLLIIFIKAESKPFKNSQFQKEMLSSHSSSFMHTNVNKLVLQTVGTGQISRQMKRMSCCAGASRYNELKKCQAPSKIEIINLYK